MGHRTAQAEKEPRGRNGIRHTRKTQKRNAPGQGRPYEHPFVRQALWDWWCGVRFAVDWKALATHNNAKGRKCLCRFPKSLIRWKVHQLQAEYAAAAMLKGDTATAKVHKSHMRIQDSKET